ncbi:MAG: hypothetical protein ACREH6_09190, partial [Geminicoccaceae bacterium]
MAAVQLAFGTLGLLVGLSALWPADLGTVDHRRAWREAVHDIEATEEAAARSDWDPSGVAPDQVASEVPSRGVSGGISAKEEASGTSGWALRQPASPQPSELANAA